MQTADPLSITFGALADPTRRAILSRLSSGEATVNELSEPFAISVQAVSRHLKVLERAGLITRRRDAQYRPCRFAAEPLDSAVGWIQEHRRIWEERFDQLERHLADIQQPVQPSTSVDQYPTVPLDPSPDHPVPTTKEQST
jgi:DNA-binding transcriptional ArsR family regulator